MVEVADIWELLRKIKLNYNKNSHRIFSFLDCLHKIGHFFAFSRVLKKSWSFYGFVSASFRFRTFYAFLGVIFLLFIPNICVLGVLDERFRRWYSSTVSILVEVKYLLGSYLMILFSWEKNKLGVTLCFFAHALIWLDLPLKTVLVRSLPHITQQ